MKKTLFSKVEEILKRIQDKPYTGVWEYDLIKDHFVYPLKDSSQSNSSIQYSIHEKDSPSKATTQLEPHFLSIVTRALSKDGAEKFIRTDISILFNENHEAIKITGEGSDVTHIRKKQQTDSEPILKEKELWGNLKSKPGSGEPTPAHASQVENTQKEFLKTAELNTKTEENPGTSQLETYRKGSAVDHKKEKTLGEKRMIEPFSGYEEKLMRQKIDQQKKIMNIILETQEEERKRIAEGLHNGLGQLLYAIKLHFENLSEGQPLKDLHAISGLLDEAIEETRNIAFELMPTILKDYGLGVTLQELCKRLSHGSLKMHLKYQLTEQLENSLKIAVFRMVQELMNNVIKHAGATEVLIEIERLEKYLSVSVKDNGRGFDAGTLKQTTGIGISSIRNRIKFLNGTFTIFSSPGKGTEAILKISYP